MVIKESIEFEKKLYDIINTCGLPVDTAFYIFKSVYLNFEKILNDCANNESESKTQEVVNYQLDEVGVSNLNIDREKGEQENAK